MANISRCNCKKSFAFSQPFLLHTITVLQEHVIWRVQFTLLAIMCIYNRIN